MVIPFLAGLQVATHLSVKLTGTRCYKINCGAGVCKGMGTVGADDGYADGGCAGADGENAKCENVDKENANQENAD